MISYNDNSPVAETDGRSAQTVLLIEDSVALSIMLSHRLQEELGIRVVCCTSMTDACAKLREQQFTLVLTGLNLPDAPHGKILRALAKTRVPVVVLTATFDAEASRRYAERKIVDYIVKDGKRSIEAVVQTVSRILTNNAFTVLVVDDARTARSGLVEFLERQNFRVLEARSGKQALKTLEADSTVDLVITDYIMPDMDGYELTRRIRELRSSDNLRIIGISSSSDRLLSASFLKAGASDFIFRPFVPEELQCRIDNNIEVLKQLQRLRRLAERDPLTGIANRRYFFEQMRALEARSTKGSVALLDIDYFKSVNDTFGHDAGDSVLKKFAEVMASLCLGGKYIPARMGGEEFAIYFHDTDPFQARAFCEGLRKAVEGMTVPTRSGDIKITVSIGLIELEPGEPFENQLQAADQLLYAAKSGGRNRVCSNIALSEARQKLATAKA